MTIQFKNTSCKPDEFDKIVALDSSYARLGMFIKEWIQGQELFTFHTSGSTGIPKPIQIKRSQITSSVKSTASALNLDNTKRILLCLNPDYIASIMMMARALILDIDILITKPSSDPLQHLSKKVDFASFVPFQVYNMIKSGSITKVNKIENILIGGAPLDSSGYQVLASLTCNAFLTYGMTETVSHIALMPIIGKYEDSQYYVLPEVEFGENNECLWVKGGMTDFQKVQTNDIVELTSNSTFKWLGRKDNVINSGGIKIHPEQLERFIKDEFKLQDINDEFYLTAKTDAQLGEALILVIESTDWRQDILEIISTPIKNQFSKYHIPREVVFLSQFERTPSGKVKRARF
ncbi:AMP-binding protein [Reichenbachiella versicolor]|uniref:AMP-binding protein n=1 Tax=Reichenbachiella versicolor TaxID=1821036 RepID=UPI000D6DF92A|nr:AMP-binding protein [Reichenbachiella versicolor]